jgi:hypothetical protein
MGSAAAEVSWKPPPTDFLECRKTRGDERGAEGVSEGAQSPQLVLNRVNYTHRRGSLHIPDE